MKTTMCNIANLSSRAELKHDHELSLKDALSSRAQRKRGALPRSQGTLRFLCLSAALTLIFSASALAQQKTQPGESPNSCPLTDDAAIRHLAEDFRDAYNRGDAAQVAALYTDSADYLTQHYADGIIAGRKNIQAYVQRGVDAHYHIDSIEVEKTSCGCSTPMPSLKARIKGAKAARKCNFAYAIARYQSTDDGQKAAGVNLIVLRKFDGNWRIVAHESAVPDPVTAIKKLE